MRHRILVWRAIDVGRTAVKEAAHDIAAVGRRRGKPRVSVLLLPAIASTAEAVDSQHVWRVEAQAETAPEASPRDR